MKRRPARIRAAATIGLAALFGACSGDDVTGPAASVAGTWAGSVTSSGGSTTTIVMVLTQTGSDVTGQGTLTDADGTTAISVLGTYSRPAVMLTISFPNTDFRPVTFSGSLTAGGILDGALNGSGFFNVRFSFRRQVVAPVGAQRAAS